MQKKMNAKTVGAVHTKYLYEISVQSKESDLENKIINIDKAKTYKKSNRFLVLSFCIL